MKTITTFLCAILIASGLMQAQTTYTVGAGKQYATITDAWNAAKADAATEFVFNVDEGTYIEAGCISGKIGMKVTIVGAGADKTIIKRSTSETFGITSTPLENPGRLFFLNAAATDINMELTLEKMSFQTIGFTNTNGGAVVNAGQADQKVTIRNCNFKNVFARTGAILQGASATTTITVENCFFENCGGKDNQSIGGLFHLTNGNFTMNNCSFLNNEYITIYNTADPNRQNGLILNCTGLISADIRLSNVNIVNTKIIDGDMDKVKPMIAVKPAVGVVPTVTLTNVVSVGNLRASSVDCDFLYNDLITPASMDFVANAAKRFVGLETPATTIIEFVDISFHRLVQRLMLQPLPLIILKWMDLLRR